MSLFTKSSFTSFIFMLFVYFVSMGLYYYQTHTIIIKETEKNIEDILLSQRALAKLVSDTQKPEIYRLQKIGFIDKDYFSPELLSSSYLTRELNRYANIEREKVGLDPLIFKFASPNPTNPSNRADFYELNIFEKLQNGKIDKYKETITEDGKEYLYYAIAGKVIEPKCLRCHGDPKDAPKDFIKKYGTENGFGWKVGNLSSIISIKAPLENIYKSSDRKFIAAAIIILILFILMFFTAEYFKKHLEHNETLLNKAHKAKKQHEQKVKYLESSLESLYGHVLSSKFDIHGNIIDISDALSRLSGYTKYELIGKPFCYFKHPDMGENIVHEIWKILMQGKIWEGEIQNRTKGGKVFWVEAEITPLLNEHRLIYAYESIMRTITTKKELEKDINIDPLTRLLNRRSFEKEFNKERQRAKRDKKFFALFMIDIDYFKEYNDTYGHQKGDKALQAVAESLEKSFKRSSDTLFRLGGEEFAVLSSESSKEKLLDSAYNACNNLHKERIEHSKSKVAKYLTISIGVVIIEKDSEIGLDSAYKESDTALYRAKEKGRNQVQYIEI